jgi:protein-tyrosine phosphatase
MATGFQNELRDGMSATELDGVINFRDFGGVPGAGGRMIRAGRLFRSGHHAAATDADLARLATLDFALLVDLRRPPERLRDVARRAEGGRARLIEHDGPSDQATPPHLTFLSDPSATAETVQRQMVVGYRGYPFDPHYVAVYREYFTLLADLDGPVLINCHAGKDRTGFLCALTLHVLGASPDAIRDDYLATNHHNRADARMAEMRAQFEVNYGRPLSPEMARVMLSVDEAWLAAAFDEVATRHGDTDAYLAEVIGLTPAMRGAIQDRLLV